MLLVWDTTCCEDATGFRLCCRALRMFRASVVLPGFGNVVRLRLCCRFRGCYWVSAVLPGLEDVSVLRLCCWVSAVLPDFVDVPMGGSLPFRITPVAMQRQGRFFTRVQRILSGGLSGKITCPKTPALFSGVGTRRWTVVPIKQRVFACARICKGQPDSILSVPKRSFALCLRRNCSGQLWTAPKQLDLIFSVPKRPFGLCLRRNCSVRQWTPLKQPDSVFVVR